VVDAFFVLHGESVEVTSAPLAAAVATAPASPGRPPERVEERREDLDLQTFFDLGRAVGLATSRSQIGETLWTHFQKELPASAFVLYGYQEASDAIVAVYQAGDTSGVQATEIPLGERLSGWVAATGQTVMNSDARLDLDESGRDASRWRSVLAVPATSNGRPVAVLSFYAETPNAFDDAQRRLIEAASRLIASSLSGLTLDALPAAGNASQNSTRVSQNSKPS
jgi:putative methionine-R-sulfoxide reductase with GAF domain